MVIPLRVQSVVARSTLMSAWITLAIQSTKSMAITRPVHSWGIFVAIHSTGVGSQNTAHRRAARATPRSFAIGPLRGSGTSVRLGAGQPARSSRTNAKVNARQKRREIGASTSTFVTGALRPAAAARVPRHRLQRHRLRLLAAPASTLCWSLTEVAQRRVVSMT